MENLNISYNDNGYRVENIRTRIYAAIIIVKLVEKQQFSHMFVENNLKCDSETWLLYINSDLHSSLEFFKYT